jgi:hypothetical protein
MNLSELIKACEKQREYGGRITLNLQKGAIRNLKGFPRGEFLSENQAGTRNYSFDAERVIKWCKNILKNGE